MFEMNGYGVLVKAPVIEEISGGGKSSKVCRLTLVQNEVIRKGENPKEISSFLDFECWDTAAENIVKYANVGDTIFVRATPRKDSWTDAEGKKHSKVYFRMNEFRIFQKREKKQD